MKYLLILITIMISGCDADSYNRHAFTIHSITHPNGVTVSKFCRQWSIYTNYRHYCKSQKCFDEYDREYNRSRLVKEVGKNETEELCSIEATENGANGNFNPEYYENTK